MEKRRNNKVESRNKKKRSQPKSLSLSLKLNAADWSLKNILTYNLPFPKRIDKLSISC